MLIILKRNANKNSIKSLLEKLKKKHIDAEVMNLDTDKLIHCKETDKNIDLSFIKRYECVRTIQGLSSPYIFSSREYKTESTIVHIDDVKLGGGNFVIIAGPCSVESKSQIKEIAHFVSDKGAKVLRGGVLKPRTSPYSFQGLGLQGLEYIKEAGEEYNLKTVCEVIEPNDVEFMLDYVDLFQIGTRNMYNYPLLRKIGQTKKPVILKRGISATVHEWLMSAEYILKEGNLDVILCERGIRTFNTYTRNTLDISVIPYIKSISHLPVIVDPSHSSGIHSLVPPLAMASVVAGSSGVMIEVHNKPEESYSDSEQAITFDEFSKLSKRLMDLLRIVSS